MDRPRRVDHATNALLSGAVRAALTAVGGPERPESGERPFRLVAPARIAQYLRSAATTASLGSGPPTEAVVAVTAACIELDKGDVQAAHVALRAAQAALRRGAP